MLLSIIIPTKNRQHTALYAIASVLAIRETDVEVIVQDCSDTAILQNQVMEKFGNDSRIKYFYTDSKPSMTENWNMALAKTEGDFCCGIGDDDAVLPEIYAIAKWARQYQIDAVVHTIPYNYTWPGFYLQPYDGTFYIMKNFSGNFSFRKDYKEKVEKFGRGCQLPDYGSLPAIYHSLVSKKLMGQLVKDTGKVLDSSCLDIYTSVAFSKYISEYVRVDYPFSLKGASAASNSQRVFTGKTKEHMAEFKSLNLPKILPNVITLQTSIAEAYIVACQNTGRNELVELIDLPLVYAHVAAEEPESYKDCLEKLDQYAPGKENKKHFSKVLYKKRMKSKKDALAVAVRKKAPFVFGIYKKLFPDKNVLKVFQVSNIMDALEIHKKNIADNSIRLHFPDSKKLG